MRGLRPRCLHEEMRRGVRKMRRAGLSALQRARPRRGRAMPSVPMRSDSEWASGRACNESPDALAAARGGLFPLIKPYVCASRTLGDATFPDPERCPRGRTRRPRVCVAPPRAQAQSGRGDRVRAPRRGATPRPIGKLRARRAVQPVTQCAGGARLSRRWVCGAECAVGGRHRKRLVCCYCGVYKGPRPGSVGRYY